MIVCRGALRLIPSKQEPQRFPEAMGLSGGKLEAKSFLQGRFGSSYVGAPARLRR